MKRAVAIMFSILFIISVIPISASADGSDENNPFNDVPEGKWFTEAVLFCKENGYEMSGAQKWIRTLFFTDASANFTLQKGKTLYECRLISSLGRHSPLLFREEGTVTCTHVLRLFSLNLFHFDFTYDYRFEGTGTKLLILLPAPIEVFVSGYGVTQLAFPGSRISDYTIYGATDFLHALERNVIGR